MTAEYKKTSFFSHTQDIMVLDWFKYKRKVQYTTVKAIADGTDGNPQSLA